MENGASFSFDDAFAIGKKKKVNKVNTKSKQNKVGLSLKRCCQTEIPVKMGRVCFLDDVYTPPWQVSLPGNCLALSYGQPGLGCIDFIEISSSWRGWTFPGAFVVSTYTVPGMELGLIFVGDAGGAQANRAPGFWAVDETQNGAHSRSATPSKIKKPHPMLRNKQGWQFLIKSSEAA